LGVSKKEVTSVSDNSLISQYVVGLPKFVDCDKSWLWVTIDVAWSSIEIGDENFTTSNIEIVVYT
jgi:hypothetical protein